MTDGVALLEETARRIVQRELDANRYIPVREVILASNQPGLMAGPPDFDALFADLKGQLEGALPITVDRFTIDPDNPDRLQVHYVRSPITRFEM